ncbi:MAG: carbonic anhydrase [Methylocella sp.]
MPGTIPPDDHATPERALLPRRLVSGYEAFLAGRFAREHDRFEQLAEVGQSPRVLVIGCCDSRVSPEVIFDAGPGEIFVIRNVANLVPPYGPDDDLHSTSAAIEYAVLGLRVNHIVLLGHARCGGVRAYADADLDPYQKPLSSGDFIGKWISLIAPAAARIGPATKPVEAYAERLALASIVQGLANLRTFPMIALLEKRGILTLHGAYFGIVDGKLLALDEASGRFLPVSREAHAAALSEPRF